MGRKVATTLPSRDEEDVFSGWIEEEAKAQKTRIHAELRQDLSW